MALGRTRHTSTSTNHNEGHEHSTNHERGLRDPITLSSNHQFHQWELPIRGQIPAPPIDSKNLNSQKANKKRGRCDPVSANRKLDLGDWAHCSYTAFKSLKHIKRDMSVNVLTWRSFRLLPPVNLSRFGPEFLLYTPVNFRWLFEELASNQHVIACNSKIRPHSTFVYRLHA